MESTMNELAKRAADNLRLVREQKSLVHNITNYVVMNYTANALLAMGASPVMAHAQNEVEEMVSLAGALVLNIGTLTDDWIASMISAGKKANHLGKPIILDPVGSGATTLRTNSAKKIINETKVSVIRGNASEILSLRDENSTTKGVDSLHSVEDATDTASLLAKELGTTLAVTGVIDLVTDGTRVIRIENGHKLMGFVTGTGCTATTAIGAFLAVDQDPVTAAATALAYFGLAGEKAAIRAEAPGSFMIAMLDALYKITPEVLEKESRFII
jgi:hydroxyethylthiazole kinase